MLEDEASHPLLPPPSLRWKTSTSPKVLLHIDNEVVSQLVKAEEFKLLLLDELSL
jgi:hypothetical protein